MLELSRTHTSAIVFLISTMLSFRMQTAFYANLTRPSVRFTTVRGLVHVQLEETGIPA